jgi:hypothetical protein
VATLLDIMEQSSEEIQNAIDKFWQFVVSYPQRGQTANEQLFSLEKQTKNLLESFIESLFPIFEKIDKDHGVSLDIAMLQQIVSHISKNSQTFHFLDVEEKN